MRRPQPGQIVGARPVRRGHVHRDAHPLQQCGHFRDVVAMPETQRRRPDQVGAHLRGPVHRPRQRAHDLEERLVRAEVLLALIAGQVQRDDRHGQAHHLGHAAGIVLDQLGGAGRAHDHRLRAEPLIGGVAGGSEQVGGVAAQVARLEGGIGHRRAVGAPLDHGEQQVGIGVALRGVQHVMQARHRGSDPQGAHMRRAFICPHAQLHSAASSRSAARRCIGRENSPARSPACS